MLFYARNTYKIVIQFKGQLYCKTSLVAILRGSLFVVSLHMQLGIAKDITSVWYNGEHTMDRVLRQIWQGLSNARGRRR